MTDELTKRVDYRKSVDVVAKAIANAWGLEWDELASDYPAEYETPSKNDIRRAAKAAIRANKTDLQAALTASQQREAAAREEIKRLRGVIGSMQQTTDALLKKLCWRPISSAPKDRRILLWHDKIYKVPHIGWWNFADEEFELIEIFKDKKEAYAPPTHWAELPGTLKAQALARQQEIESGKALEKGE